jgi:uncharacterized protein YndB with AHSA1/START domain
MSLPAQVYGAAGFSFHDHIDWQRLANCNILATVQRKSSITVERTETQTARKYTLAQFQVETTIQRPADAIFQLIADLPNYAQWLPGSGTFGQITMLSDPPFGLGARYRDVGPSTRMEGSIVEYDPPHRLAFEQHTQQRLLGVPSALTVRATYELTDTPSGTRVVRRFDGKLRGLFWLLQPYVIPTLKRENERILAMMKAYLEN